MVTIKEAAANATKFAIDVLNPAQYSRIQLEEVDSTSMDGRDAWIITLSFEPPDTLSNILNGAKKRDYKVFTVLKESGEVHSMKMREFSTN